MIGLLMTFLGGILLRDEESLSIGFDKVSRDGRRRSKMLSAMDVIR